MHKRLLIVLLLIFGLLAATFFFLFEQTEQLAGVVRDATTQSPIVGATVSLAAETTSTDAQGRYSVPLPRGQSTIHAFADGYLPIQQNLSSAALSARAFSLDLQLSPNHLVGTVRDAETGQALPNVQILIGDRSVTADAQGAFQISGVKSGVSIAAQAPGFEPAVTAFAGQSDLQLALAPNTVTISVVDKYTGRPLSQVLVQQGSVSATTDANGQAALRRIKPGVPISATLTGHETGAGEFAGGEVKIALRPNTLAGVVTSAVSGQPISGTLVYLGRNIVSTDAKGEYRFDNVPEKATLVLKAPGFTKAQIDASGTTQRDIKLAPFLVKAIHIPFALPADRVRELLDMVGKTELNAIVIDVKSEKGRIAWDSNVPTAKAIDAPLLIGIDLKEVIQRCKSQNIYCIARLAVFQDTRLANAYPDLAIRNSDGTTVYADSGGASWANPYKTQVWDYDLDLAKEIAAMGFDEVQFDYVRFPGDIPGLYFGTTSTLETRIAAVTGFLARAQKELRPSGVFLSADVYGLTTATTNEQGIGQRLQDLGPYVDYLSPMVYPDTWATSPDLVSTGLGISNCPNADECPYDIIYNSYKHAAEKTPTKIRLWLQAYPGHTGFGVAQFRLQKKAANDSGSCGWMFWNPTGTYDPKTFDPATQ